MPKTMFPNKAWLCIVIIREYSLLFARGRLSKRWPVVLMCDLTCQVSRDGRNLLTSPLCTVTTITIITLSPPWHLYPDQPRSKITNKTKPPIVQATPNLLTGVTQPGVMFANLFSHSLRSQGGHQVLSHVSLPAPRDHWHAERGSAQIKLDWCQLP